LIVGCTTAAPKADDRAALAASSQGALASFKAKDPTVQSLINKSVGWAIFPDIGKAAFFVGGSYGRGEVYERGKLIGYADLTGVSGGFTWGAQSYSQLLLFLRQEDLDKFKRGDWSLEGNVSAVLLTAGAAGRTDPSKGVIAIVDTKGGAMAEASLGGQRFRFTPL
jgi:lipid-binding SYLF domain-containing protein